MGRDNGFNGPLGVDQVFTWVTIPVLFACFFVASASFIPDDGTRVGVLVVTSLLFVFLIGFWFYCEYADPSKPGGLGCMCMRETQKSIRYCGHCRKSVPGMDHHCTWLNTCVGKRNYWAFYLLSVAGTVSFVLQTVLYTLMITTYRTEQNTDSVGSEDAYIAILVVAILLSLSATGAFGSLFTFHTYLLITRQSTYDWLLQSRNQKLERDTRRAFTSNNPKSKPQNKSLIKKKNQSPPVSPGGSEASAATTTTAAGAGIAAVASASSIHIEETEHVGPKRGKSTRRTSAVVATSPSDDESESHGKNNNVVTEESEMSEI